MNKIKTLMSLEALKTVKVHVERKKPRSKTSNDLVADKEWEFYKSFVDEKIKIVQNGGEVDMNEMLEEADRRVASGQI